MEQNRLLPHDVATSGIYWLDQLLSCRAMALRQSRSARFRTRSSSSSRPRSSAAATHPERAIPSERELSEVLAVNRHVVREAVKRLEQIGLVKVRTGRPHEGARLPPDRGAGPAGAARRARGAVGGAAATARGGAGDAGRDRRRRRAPVRTAGRRRAWAASCSRSPSSSRRRPTAPSCSRSTSASGSAILDGAGNLAYQLAFNSLIRAVHALHDLSLPWLEQELARSDYRRPIAAAIAAGDAEGAATATRVALTPPEGYRPLARAARATEAHAMSSEQIPSAYHGTLTSKRADLTRLGRLLAGVHRALLARAAPLGATALALGARIYVGQWSWRDAPAAARAARRPAVRRVGDPQIPAAPAPVHSCAAAESSSTGRSSTATTISPPPTWTGCCSSRSRSISFVVQIADRRSRCSRSPSRARSAGPCCRWR